MNANQTRSFLTLTSSVLLASLACGQEAPKIRAWEQSYQIIPDNSHPDDAYYSPNLQAYLRVVRVSVPGFQPFIGAMVVMIEPSSALERIGLQPGDVISRLDGIWLATGRYPVWTSPGAYYALPQAERHYGRTEVRFLRRGTNRFEQGVIDLGPSWNPTPIGSGGTIGP